MVFQVITLSWWLVSHSVHEWFVFHQLSDWLRCVWMVVLVRLSLQMCTALLSYLQPTASNPQGLLHFHFHSRRRRGPAPKVFGNIHHNSLHTNTGFVQDFCFKIPKLKDQPDQVTAYFPHALWIYFTWTRSRSGFKFFLKSFGLNIFVVLLWISEFLFNRLCVDHFENLKLSKTLAKSAISWYVQTFQAWKSTPQFSPIFKDCTNPATIIKNASKLQLEPGTTATVYYQELTMKTTGTPPSLNCPLHIVPYWFGRWTQMYYNLNTIFTPHSLSFPQLLREFKTCKEWFSSTCLLWGKLLFFQSEDVTSFQIKYARYLKHEPNENTQHAIHTKSVHSHQHGWQKVKRPLTTHRK